MTKDKIQPYYIYKICSDNCDEVYVGSTTDMRQRKTLHKRTCNNEKYKSYNLKIYQTIRSNGGWNEWRMVIIHECGDTTRNGAEIIEEKFRLELVATMNSQRAHQTPENKKEYDKQYRLDHKEEKKQYRLDHIVETKQYNQQYHETNKEQINTKSKIKITCDCGCKVRTDCMTTHKKTQKHLNLILLNNK